jgi:RimJ/RimL family protein N-acetyltransferase
VTNAVYLREVNEADLAIFFEQQREPEAIKMAAFPSREAEAFLAHWHKIMRDPTVILRTIVYQGQVAGNIVSFVQAGQREVGYWIGKEYWGQGIATRALELYLQQVGERPLYAHVAKHNLGSQRVLEKCGFILIGEDRWTNPDGQTGEEYTLKLA